MNGISSASITPSNVSPVAGRADLRLRIADQDIDLAKCKWVVALVISASNETTFYWIQDGLCSEIENSKPRLFVHAQIEARCCPGEYELPPQIISSASAACRRAARGSSLASAIRR